MKISENRIKMKSFKWFTLLFCSQLLKSIMCHQVFSSNLKKIQNIDKLSKMYPDTINRHQSINKLKKGSDYQSNDLHTDQPKLLMMSDATAYQSPINYQTNHVDSSYDSKKSTDHYGTNPVYSNHPKASHSMAHHSTHDSQNLFNIYSNDHYSNQQFQKYTNLHYLPPNHHHSKWPYKPHKPVYVNHPNKVCPLLLLSQDIERLSETILFALMPTSLRKHVTRIMDGHMGKLKGMYTALHIRFLAFFQFFFYESYLHCILVWY